MMLNGFSIHSDTRYQLNTTLASEMYWFVVWSFVALFSYNYTAADANTCVTRDEIDRQWDGRLISMTKSVIL